MKSKLFQTLTMLALMLLVIPSSLVAAAVPPEPTYVDEGATPPIYAPTVDGLTTDWDLANDFFSNMYRAGGTTTLLAKLYARYDCGTGSFYVLVLAEPGIVIDSADNPDVHFVKLNNVKKVDGNDYPPDGTLPDFAWVGLSGGGSTALGWEASMFLAQGVYTRLNVHTNVLDPASQTAAVPGREINLTLDCTPPTSVDLASFTAESAGPAIQLAWETVSEVDTLGFNLYRATAADGSRTRLNAALIAGQLPGSSMGATYSLLDDTALRGVTYYYWLEDVDANGVATLHGPVTASLKAYFKSLPGRPRPLPAPGTGTTIRVQ